MGSSPLARGLRGRRPRPPHPHGIIPARAGFTSSPPSTSSTPSDHPRSRGVYGGVSCVVGGLEGSSPLARGLLCQTLGRLPDVGIIPARAGFTRAWAATASQKPDHPRSRGVYSGFYRLQSSVWGSSPLARGLRDRGERLHGPMRIIPARAGFTPRAVTRSTGSWDHPRSRGVYTG